MLSTLTDHHPPGQTYHGDFIYGWDKAAGCDLVRKPTGASSAANQSSACQALNEQDPFLQKADWAAMLEAKAGKAEVEVGTYGRGLTITDGKSVNASWGGAWGEGAGNASVLTSSLSNSFREASAAPSLASPSASVSVADVKDFSSTLLPSSTPSVPSPAPLSQTPPSRSSSSYAGLAAAASSAVAPAGRASSAPAAGAARRGHARTKLRRAH